MEEKRVSYKKTVGIGAIAGFMAIFLPLIGVQILIMPGTVIPGIVAFLIMDSAIGIIGIPFGIIGALIGKFFLKTSAAIWVGGIVVPIFMVINTGIMGGLCPILGGC